MPAEWLYALATLVFSLLVLGVSLLAAYLIGRRRRRGRSAGNSGRS